MEYAKKSITGYSPCKAHEEAEFVLLTVEEYWEIRKQYTELKNKIDLSESLKNAEIFEVKGEYAREIELLDQKYREQIEEKSRMLSKALTDRDRYVDLNQNLLRICAERANAERKLKNKKERSGYLLAGTREANFRLKNGKYVDAWETTLRTPWPYNMTAAAVKTAFRHESGILTTLGIVSDDIYDAKLQLGRDGYWEVRIRHQNGITKIPSDLCSF